MVGAGELVIDLNTSPSGFSSGDALEPGWFGSCTSRTFPAFVWRTGGVGTYEYFKTYTDATRFDALWIERTHCPSLLTSWRLVLWPIPFLLWPPAALLLRSGIIARRRAITGKCQSCGYNLVGLPSTAACPECGKAGEQPQMNAD